MNAIVSILGWLPILILVVLILILLIGNIVIVQQSKAYVWSGWGPSAACGAWDCT